MLDDEIARQVVPVSHRAGDAPGRKADAPAAAARGAGKAEQGAKLARRIVALPPGRYLLVVTVDEGGPRDWSVQPLGKVEQ